MIKNTSILVIWAITVVVITGCIIAIVVTEQNHYEWCQRNICNEEP